MRTNKQAEIDFKSTAQHHIKLHFWDAKRRSERTEYQRFVVPWQMIEEEEKEILIK